MVQSDPNLNLELIRLLGHDLKEAERHVTHMAQKPVRERVAEALLLVKETYGYEPDGQTLNLRMTREELANLVGTATETVIRLLSDFNKQGLIHLEGKKIQIMNDAGLTKEAQLWD
jgi:CRP/FNR family transcriptional regulator